MEIESIYYIAFVGNNEAKGIFSFMKSQLPRKYYNKILGINIGRFMGDFYDESIHLNVQYVTVNKKTYAFYPEVRSAANLKRIRLTTQTAAIFIVFSVADFESSFAIGRKWIPAMKLYFPNIPIVLVGYNNNEEFQKVDEKRKNTADNYSVNLTNDAEAISKSNEISNKITTEMGKQIAREIKAVKYFEVSTFSREESNIIFEEAIRVFLHNRKALRSCKIAVVGSPDSGKTEIIQQFVFGERLSILDEYMNEQQYLYDTDDTIFATSIEIDGEEFDLRIQDVLLQKDNKQWKLSNIEKVAPTMEELEDSIKDDYLSTESYADRFLFATIRTVSSVMTSSLVAKRGLEERTICVTRTKQSQNYWLKDVDAVIFVFSVVQPSQKRY